MSALDVDEASDPEPPPAKAKDATPKVAHATREVAPVHGRNGYDDELHLVASVMMDPAVLYPRAAHLPPEAFQGEIYRSLWSCFSRGMMWPDDLPGIVKATKAPAAALFEISHAVPTEAGFSGYLGVVEEKYRGRRFLELVSEMSKTINPDPAMWAQRLEELTPRKKTPDAAGLPLFTLPEASDASVLLGDRYLNRGDGLVLSSTSGMGKSSIDLQMAVCFALGRPFHGLKCNGPLRSLIVQAEDSQGDIAEVWLSIRHAMRLSEEDIAKVTERVLIVTERVRRGQAFLDELRRLVAKHKPDLVHINPLQAFIDGDVTESKDLGAFLRGGLNALNEPATFGYVIVHHTVKPATGKNRVELLWHEEMYGMAGGAEIINWARAIMILKATTEPGEFNLVLAKRGVRAGVTREVSQGAGVRDEIVTSVPLKHSSELIDIPGRQRKLRCIFWEARAPGEAAGAKGNSGRPRKHSFEKFAPAFPRDRAGAISLSVAFRNIKTKGYGEISRSSLDDLIDYAVHDGQLLRISRDDPRYYLSS